MHRAAAMAGIRFRKFTSVVMIGVIFIFIIAASLAVAEEKYRVVSSSLDQWTSNMSSEAFMYVMGYENPYFRQTLADGSDPFSPSELIFKLATNIDPEDPRSYLGTELPGLALFDTEIVVAGKGTNISNMPIESAPPLEVMKKDKEAATKNVDKSEEEEKAKTPTTKGKEVVFIYHSHTEESFLPHLKNITDPNAAWHSKVNITLVGERLGKELKERGIGSIVNTENVTDIYQKRGWDYPDSYRVSEEIVKEAMGKHDDLKFFFDIHRDSQPRNITTVSINNKKYARPFFVVGKAHKGYEKNLKLAKEFHHRLEKQFPGLSRGVFSKDKSQGNGVYNQDLSENALIMEIGGYNNTLEELYRTTEALADVISEYYWDEQKAKKS